MKLSLVFATLLLSCLGFPVQAKTTNVAVASNFTAAAKDIEKAFEAATGHDVVFSFGSTGKLYTQIIRGAPFDVFLAADAKHPHKLEMDGQGVMGTRFTYALGQIVLWSSKEDQDVKRRLDGGRYAKLAIANPKTAPYGVAALQVLEKLKLLQNAQDKLVKGDGVAQTHQFVSSGAADMGFVALAQVTLDPSGSHWPVATELYDPITQQAVLLTRGVENSAAKAFMRFLQGPEASKIIRTYGYGTEE